MKQTDSEEGAGLELALMYTYAVYKYIHSIALLRAVVKTTSRTSLALTDNGIGDRGGTTLAKALETNTELTF